jgi:hypothetical protein
MRACLPVGVAARQQVIRGSEQAFGGKCPRSNDPAIIQTHRYRQNRYFALFRYKRQKPNNAFSRQIPQSFANPQGLPKAVAAGSRSAIAEQKLAVDVGRRKLKNDGR